MLTVLDLFSGIGGFSLGLERTGGFKTVAFCEIDPFCRKVLAKHWPGVPIHDDITTLAYAPRQRCQEGGQLRPNGGQKRIACGGATGAPRTVYDGPIDVICGGFPCQDISTAGRGEGIEGARSGLWSEYARLIGEIRPRYVIVENVSALLGRGLDRVLGDLSTLGFDAEWHCIPASAIGAPHRRDRVWIVAHPRCRQQSQQRNAVKMSSGRPSAKGPASAACRSSGNDRTNNVANPEGQRCREAREHRERSEEWTASSGVVADADSGRGRTDIAGGHNTDRTDAGRPQANGLSGTICEDDGARAMADAYRARQGQFQEYGEDAWRAWYGAAVASGLANGANDQWRTEPDVGRVAHGVPQRVDRLRSLGNAVVPQVVEVIGNAILEAA